MTEKRTIDWEKLTKSQDIACQALLRIDEEGLKPNPENYALWYKYYEGDSEVKGALDKQAKTGLDDASCHDVYKKLMGNTSYEEAVRKVSDQVQQAVSEIAGLLSSVKTATSEFGASMKDVPDKLEQADSIEDLATVVTAIVKDTKKMVEHNQQLETQLNNSSLQVAELKKSLDSVRKEAMTDGLTGLANRKSFDSQIARAIEEAETNEAQLTLLMIDIDHFKAFNDNYGHQIGDQVLRLVARTLTDGVKGRDLAARYGGEEFAIILPETPLQAGVSVANSLRRAVESKEVFNRTSNENLGQITLSVGVAEFASGETPEELVDRADAALYTAKHNGRNQVAAAPPPGS